MRDVAVAEGAAPRAPLFVALLGRKFERLAPPLKRLHATAGNRHYRGNATVIRGRGWISWLLGQLAALPPAAERIDIAIAIEVRGERERWTRHFGSYRMCSTLWRQGDLLCERLGPLRFTFALDVPGNAIEWRVVHIRALGVPLPVRWFGGVRAHEFAANGAYCFDVAAALPLVGLLVRYRGTLDGA